MYQQRRSEAPKLARIREAGALYRDASRAMIETTAHWLDIDRELLDAGFDDVAIVRAYAAAYEAWPGGRVPSPVVMWVAFQRCPDPELAAELYARASAGDDKWALTALGTMALAIQTRAGAVIGAADEPLFSSTAPWQARREVLEAMPPARRGPFIASTVSAPQAPNSAAGQLERILPLIDLLEGPEIRDALESLCTYLEAEGWAGDLVGQIRAGIPVERAPTAEVDHLVHKYRDREEAAGLGDVARRIHGRGHVEVSGAVELATLDAWRGCGDERRAAIAASVVAALDGAIVHVGFGDFGAGPIALFEHSEHGVELALVPGGVVQRGLSDREESLIRQAAAANRDVANWFEEYGQLLEARALATMRPVAAVEVGPLLACRDPIPCCAPDELPELMTGAAPFRFPSEVEWEHLARGGRVGELTWRGHRIPDEAHLAEIGRGDVANPFGGRGFGLEPEVCADAWHSSYDGAPATAEPWWGDGDRAVRGGAAQIYPWQACGEWHLLCSAVRQPSRVWEYAVSGRPVISIRPR